MSAHALVLPAAYLFSTRVWSRMSIVRRIHVITNYLFSIGIAGEMMNRGSQCLPMYSKDSFVFRDRHTDQEVHSGHRTCAC